MNESIEQENQDTTIIEWMNQLSEQIQIMNQQLQTIIDVLSEGLDVELIESEELS
jgi:hypothetical protein